MSYFIALLSFMVLSQTAPAYEPATKPATQPTTKPAATVNEAIERGLEFMVNDSQAWKKEHNCVSCHHAAIMIWSMREARQRGHTVNEPILAELTRWVAEAGDGRVSQSRPAEAPNGLNTKALHFAAALASDPNPDAVSVSGMKKLLGTVKSDQTQNGSWQSWPDTRPPIFGKSDESATALAVIAMMPAAASGDEEAKAARDKGIKWLTETKSDEDPQSIALRLVIWQRMGRPSEECAKLVKHIRDRQNADGGWSQTKEMPGDAWATGQALYALAVAGIPSSDPTIQRGQTFLMKTQRDDGSWVMTSRPSSADARPAKNLMPITGAGSAWAVMGLARSR